MSGSTLIKKILHSGQSTKGKGNLQDWKKIFASHLSDKRLIPKLYRDLLQHNNLKH